MTITVVDHSDGASLWLIIAVIYRNVGAWLWLTIAMREMRSEGELQRERGTPRWREDGGVYEMCRWSYVEEGACRAARRVNVNGAR